MVTPPLTASFMNFIVLEMYVLLRQNNLVRMPLVVLSIGFPLQQRLGGPQGMTIDWKPPGSPSSFLVKRVLRLDIPVERYPTVSLRKSPLLRLKLSTSVI